MLFDRFFTQGSKYWRSNKNITNIFVRIFLCEIDISCEQKNSSKTQKE